MLIDEGCWIGTCNGYVGSDGKPALFLDRDGVLIRDAGYLADPAGVELLPGAGELVRIANRANVPVIVVTNQSGIGRGLFSWRQFLAVNRRMSDLLASDHGATLSAVIACGWSPANPPDPAVLRRRWRKPGPGMLLAARSHYGIDLARSWLVGDRLSDVRAAMAAGLAGAILLKPGLRQVGQGRTQPHTRHHDFLLWRAAALPPLLAQIEATMRQAMAAPTIGAALVPPGSTSIMGSLR